MNKWCCILFVFAVATSCGNVDNADFDSINEEEIAQGFKDGWLPPNMSKDAFQIKVSRDTENGHVFGKYAYEDSEFAMGLKALPSSKEQFEKRRASLVSPEEPAWFDLVHADQLVYNKFGAFLFVIDKQKKQVYFLR